MHRRGEKLSVTTNKESEQLNADILLPTTRTEIGTAEGKSNESSVEMRQEKVL